MDTAYLHIPLNIFKYLKQLTYKALEGIAANYMSLLVYADHKPTFWNIHILSNVKNKVFD